MFADSPVYDAPPGRWLCAIRSAAAPRLAGCIARCWPNMHHMSANAPRACLVGGFQHAQAQLSPDLSCCPLHRWSPRSCTRLLPKPCPTDKSLTPPLDPPPAPKRPLHASTDPTGAET